MNKKWYKSYVLALSLLALLLIILYIVIYDPTMLQYLQRH